MAFFMDIIRDSRRKIAPRNDLGDAQWAEAVEGDISADHHAAPVRPAAGGRPHPARSKPLAGGPIVSMGPGLEGSEERVHESSPQSGVPVCGAESTERASSPRGAMGEPAHFEATARSTHARQPGLPVLQRKPVTPRSGDSPGPVPSEQGVVCRGSGEAHSLGRHPVADEVPAISPGRQPVAQVPGKRAETPSRVPAISPGTQPGAGKLSITPPASPEACEPSDALCSEACGSRAELDSEADVPPPSLPVSRPGRESNKPGSRGHSESVPPSDTSRGMDSIEPLYISQEAVEAKPVAVVPGRPAVTAASHRNETNSESGLPRVRIGQVNVMVESVRETRKLKPPADQREDLASRTFLRSL